MALTNKQKQAAYRESQAAKNLKLIRFWVPLEKSESYKIEFQKIIDNQETKEGEK